MGGAGQISLQQAWEALWTLLRDPYSNITASILLLAAVVVFVLLVAVTLIAIVAPRRRHVSYDEDELRALLEILQSEDDEAETGETVEGWDAQPVRPAAPPAQRAQGLPWWAWALSIAGGLLLVSIAIGWTTSEPQVCKACHDSSAHAEAVKAGGTDPHASVSCVRCHESSGLIGSLTIEVPGRLGHMLAAASQDTSGTNTSYGDVMSSSCRRCHESVLTKTVEDAGRGVRTSHREPVAAGASCTDCHTLSTGVVSSVTVGMSPCLRCHDGKKESADCAVCHTKDIGAASRSRQNPAKMTGKQLVKTPDCGGCHDQATQCDPCHGGVRMPHSELFMAYGHARQGVEDLWNNNGKTCGRCHTAKRRPCTQCHSTMPGHPTTPWKSLHGASGSAKSCDNCHARRAVIKGRDFCGLCHGEVVTQ